MQTVLGGGVRPAGAQSGQPSSAQSGESLGGEGFEALLTGAVAPASSKSIEGAPHSGEDATEQAGESQDETVDMASVMAFNASALVNEQLSMSTPPQVTGGMPQAGQGKHHSLGHGPLGSQTVLQPVGVQLPVGQSGEVSGDEMGTPQVKAPQVVAAEVTVSEIAASTRSVGAAGTQGSGAPGWSGQAPSVQIATQQPSVRIDALALKSRDMDSSVILEVQDDMVLESIELSVPKAVRFEMPAVVQGARTPAAPSIEPPAVDLAAEPKQEIASEKAGFESESASDDGAEADARSQQQGQRQSHSEGRFANTTRLTAQGAAPASINAPAASINAPVEVTSPLPNNAPAQTSTPGRPTMPDTESIMRQITDGLRVKTDGGIRRAEMVLQPEALGKVQMEMEIEGQNVRLRLITERSDVQALARAQEGQLRSALMAQGLQIESITIETAEPPVGQQHHEGQQPGNGFGQTASGQGDGRRHSQALDHGPEDRWGEVQPEASEAPVTAPGRLRLKA
ncbi:MAG: flagellar hook-length control protein FliK [Bradymonadia bacterium]